DVGSCRIRVAPVRVLGLGIDHLSDAFAGKPADDRTCQRTDQRSGGADGRSDDGARRRGAGDATRCRTDTRADGMRSKFRGLVTVVSFVRHQYSPSQNSAALSKGVLGDLLALGMLHT